MAAVSEPRTCYCGMWDKPCTTEIPPKESLCAVCRLGCARIILNGVRREHVDFDLTQIIVKDQP